MYQEAVEKAVAHDRNLLLSQIDRAEKMNNIPAPVKKTIRLASSIFCFASCSVNIVGSSNCTRLY